MDKLCTIQLLVQTTRPQLRQNKYLRMTTLEDRLTDTIHNRYYRFGVFRDENSNFARRCDG